MAPACLGQPVLTLASGILGSNLARFVGKRLAYAIPLIFAVIAINFFLIHLAPGDPVSILAGPLATPEYVARLRAYYGMDTPLVQQFFIYLWSVLQGNLGFSIKYNQPVLGIILDRFPATVLLMSAGLFSLSLIGILFGVVSAWKQNSKTDKVITIFSLGSYSIPTFWIGILLILAFTYYIRIFPSNGMTSSTLGETGLTYVADVLYHLVLPAITLGLFYLGVIFRLTRESMVGALNGRYVLTARSKGLEERTVVFKHALRNALLPVVTVIGLNIGYMFGGAVITETIFGWPGLGTLLYIALQGRDYPVVMGVFIFISISVIIANLLTDIVYAYIDPRIRLS